jgi:xanthine dehydrogenase accessory factor
VTNTWQFIQDKFSAGIAVILLYVLESKGSSPGRRGFNMAVAADGEFFGTIGGGIMEHKFVEMARAHLRERDSQAEVIRQVHDKSAARNQSGMICSGEQTIFLYAVQEKDIPHIHVLVESLSQYQNGTLTLQESGITFSTAIPVSDFHFNQADETHFTFVEKTGLKNVLHIIGGGHCALAFSHLVRRMDFYVTVYDERDGLSTMQLNRDAHQQIVVGSYTELSGLIEEGDNVYVVIMTFGYRSDDMALRALLDKKFKYIGMLGSASKIKKMRAAYQAEGIDESKLNVVHAPIGIAIKSQTAEEIAVSIAAEIIAVKNKDQ